MTSTSMDTNSIEAAARALLDGKISAVRELAIARQAVADHRAALDEAERLDAAAYATALRAGWTPDELKKVGLAAPARKAPGRPRRTRAATQDSGQAARSGDGDVQQRG